MRIPRWTIVLTAGVATVALVALAASLVVLSTDPPPAPTGTPRPTRTPKPLDATEVAVLEVMDDQRPLEARITSLKALCQEAKDAGPLIRVLRRLDPAAPDGLQVRAMTITALGRFPSDPAAREELVVLAFQKQNRGERRIALDVLAKRTDLDKCRKPLEVLAKDAEADVATRAKELLEKLP